MNFPEKLNQALQQNRSLLCVGLDPDPARLPAPVRHKDDPILYFNQKIIDATADLVCCYKPNFAFYGALGARGWRTLKATLEHIPDPLPVLVDAKVGDIGNTAGRYAVMFFEELGADALTVTPYMGTDAVAPFAAYEEKGVFVVCLSSNPGADDFEKRSMGEMPLYQHVVRKAKEWNRAGNCGLVVGATQPGYIGAVRALAPEMPLLVPGIGAQGGDLKEAVEQGQDACGRGLLLNSARGILYASSGDDFATAARRAARQLRDRINLYRR